MTRTRSNAHAQATRGSRTDTEVIASGIAPTEAEARARALEHAQAEAEAKRIAETHGDAPETETETPETLTPEAEAEARMEALKSVLAEADKTEALNALVSAHFSGSVATMLRTIIRSVDPDVRNRALFTRRASADGSVISYDLAGSIGTITRDSAGRFRQDGFLMHARDKSGNTFEKRFGDGTSTYDNVTTPEKNMLAGWRNGVIWTLNERETERVKHSGADNKALADMQAKLAETEARAQRAEAEAKRSAEANAEALQSMSAKVDALLASLLARDAEAK